MLAVVVAACSGSDRNNAATCGADYKLGCVGDGRPDSQTTPGILPTTSCAKDAYTYFKVHVTATSPRADIAQCRLVILDPQGQMVAAYLLPGVADAATGSAYGCLPGQTPADVGILSYSSCCAANEELTFDLAATSSAQTVVEYVNVTATCAPYPPEVSVELTMQRSN